MTRPTSRPAATRPAATRPAATRPLVFRPRPGQRVGRPVFFGNQYTVRLTGGQPIAAVWHGGAGVLYVVVPPSPDGRCRFTIGLAGTAGVDSPVEPVRFDIVPAGETTSDAFADLAYAAADRLAPLVDGDGSGVFTGRQANGRAVRYAVPPPVVGRAAFAADVRTVASGT